MARKGKIIAAAPPTIWIYQPIGGIYGEDAVTPMSIRDQLAEHGGGGELTLRINSPGGVVDDAVAIFTLLRECPTRITAKIDGIAASAATIVAMAADRIEAATGAMMMIHNPWGLAIGDGDDLRAAAAIADKYRENAAGIYAARSRQPLDAVLAAMAGETWFTADEAVAWGLADAVAETPAIAAAVDLALFAYHKTPAQLVAGAAAPLPIHRLRAAVQLARLRLTLDRK